METFILSDRVVLKKNTTTWSWPIPESTKAAGTTQQFAKLCCDAVAGSYVGPSAGFWLYKQEATLRAKRAK